MFRNVAAVSMDPTEHFKRSWIYAADRASAEGFHFEAVPTEADEPDTPCAYITCLHTECRSYGYDVTSLVISGDIALEGLKRSGLAAELDHTQRCSLRRRRLLGKLLPELRGDDRFLAGPDPDLPDGLTLHVTNDGTDVSIECEHTSCGAAGYQEVGASWTPRMAFT